MSTDYGMGLTNIDRDTGIRYGVIPANDIEYWYEHAEANYGEPSCPDCGGLVVEFDDEEHGEYGEQHTYVAPSWACASCRIALSDDSIYPDSPISHDLDEEGIVASSGGDGDIFIMKSPFFTFAPFCSPCAPGAVWLLDGCDYEGAKGYCFGHDWFDGKAPYPVYSVETGNLVEPEAEE